MIEQQEVVDFSRVPVSKGMSNSTLVIVITGVIMIFIVGGLVIGFSGYGHLWPSTHTQRMDLGRMPTAQ